MKMRSNHYYAKRLLSQAIADPSVNALNGDEMETYISDEAEKLCLPAEQVTDCAMREYELIASAGFESRYLVKR